MARSSPASRTAARLLVTASIGVLAADVSAHRRDELLQAARIGIDPDRVRVEMGLTPGIAMADRVIREIDEDGDAVLSPAEQQTYAARLLSRVTLRVDDSPPLPLSMAGSSFPAIAVLRTGTTAISFRLEARLPALPAGAHRLTFHNGDASDDSVYLANALVPDSDRVAVTDQLRDVDQRQLTIAFDLRETAPSGRAWMWLGLGCTLVLTTLVTRRRVPAPPS